MTAFLLDTDILCFFYGNQENERTAIEKNVLSLSEGDSLQASILSLFELEYSYFLAEPAKKAHIRTLINNIERNFEVLSLESDSAIIYGELKSKLKLEKDIKSGNMKKHNIDIMLASTAIIESSVLVSNDSIFTSLSRHSPLLKTENWLL